MDSSQLYSAGLRHRRRVKVEEVGLCYIRCLRVPRCLVAVYIVHEVCSFRNASSPPLGSQPHPDPPPANAILPPPSTNIFFFSAAEKLR